MKINFNATTPIYMQIVEYLKFDIIAKVYSPGERLPSIRDLALELKINPNTVQKALIELENLKLVYTETTNGKFITKDEKVIEKYKKEYIKNITNDYLKQMNNLGKTKEEIIKIIGGK